MEEKAVESILEDDTSAKLAPKGAVSAVESGPSPHEVASTQASQYAVSVDDEPTSRNRAQGDHDLQVPPSKRLKSVPSQPSRPHPQPTPDMASETAPTPRDVSQSDSAVPSSIIDSVAVHKSSSSGSLGSEYSSVSASSRQESLSPVPHATLREAPAAPPSTPASHSSVFSWDAAATPLPILMGAIQNADRLEQQQLLLQDGAVTPAPTRPEATTDAEGPPALGKQQAALPEDFSEWAVGDRYELLRILGRGSYGEVAQAIDLHAGRRDAFVAIKRILSPFDQEIDAIRLYREIHILRRMRGHDCVIQLLDIVQPPTDDIDDFHDLYLVFEYVDTDLYKLIMSPQYLTTEHIQTFLYQILVALKYIHSFSVIHRDLKPANILLNEDCSLKICDFGLARIVDSATMVTSTTQDDQKSTSGDETPRSTSSFGIGPPKAGLTRQLTKHVVTRWYRAPELILIQPYTSAVDIWSVGCILAELLSMQDGNVPSYQDRKPIFPGGFCYPLSSEGDKVRKDERLDQLNVIFKVIGTPPPEDITAGGKVNEYIKSLKKQEGTPFERLFPVADPAAIDLLKRMLHFNPQKRCTAAEALEHDFFAGIRRSEFERVADGPLEAPAFLETKTVDLKDLKQKTFEEVVWFRDQGAADMSVSSSS